MKILRLLELWLKRGRINTKMKIKENLVKIRNILTQSKIYFTRSMSYMGLGNSILLILVLLKVEENPILNKWIIPIVMAWVFFLIFLGWFEINIVKSQQKEIEQFLEINPPQKYIYEGIKEIKKDIKELKGAINEKE